MEAQILKYDLPDFKAFFDDPGNNSICSWIPEKAYVILGSSNKAVSSLHIENITEDGIDIYKRPSGGESVILSPKTLVFSALMYTDELKNPKSFFDFCNKLIIKALEKSGIENLGQKGISDVSVGEKKILGSSIYRKGNKLFYHCVLNVSESTSLMARYLKHPPREPEYRKGRPHTDFVTSLKELSFNDDPSFWEERIRKEFNEAGFSFYES